MKKRQKEIIISFCLFFIKKFLTTFEVFGRTYLTKRTKPKGE